MNRYTADQLSFIKHGFKLWRLPLLTLFFNAWFGQDKTEQQIRSTLKNHRFTCGRKPGFDKGYSKMYSKEQLAWIKEAYKTWSPPDLAREFNKKFGANISASQMRSCCHNRGWLSGRDCTFQNGSKPWNAGTKGVMKPNSGNFKKGSVPANRKPLGTERICSKDGYVLVKVAERNPYTGAPTLYRAKHVVNWEAVNGKVPAGFILRFKDGNKRNCAPENLELITRAEHARLNKIHYNDFPEEFKPAVRTIVQIQMKVGSLKPKQENGAQR